MTGMREQEVMHTYWRDINFADSVVRVPYKPDLGWTPKGLQRARDSDTNKTDAFAKEVTG